jgi:hypothetical protein
MPSVEGFAKARTDPVYPGVDNGTPLLSKFYFGYDVAGPGPAVDNHLNTIMVMPAGRVEDLSPGAGIPGPVIAPGRIGLIYQDDNPDDAEDRYLYRAEHLTRSAIAPRRFRLRDVGCVGTCERPLPRPPGIPRPPGSGLPDTFVLIGFQLFFTGNRDHHIDDLAVFERDNHLMVKLNDRNDDDVFGYVVDYALVGGAGLNIQLGEERGDNTLNGEVVSLPGQEPKVIRGFEFNFHFDDNHIREVGVLASSDRLEVFFRDREIDIGPGGFSQDRFRWKVRWASISPMVVQEA